MTPEQVTAMIQNILTQAGAVEGPVVADGNRRLVVLQRYPKPHLLIRVDVARVEVVDGR